jgi:ribosomal protein L23
MEVDHFYLLKHLRDSIRRNDTLKAEEIINELTYNIPPTKEDIKRVCYELFQLKENKVISLIIIPEWMRIGIHITAPKSASKDKLITIARHHFKEFFQDNRYDIIRLPDKSLGVDIDNLELRTYRDLSYKELAKLSLLAHNLHYIYYYRPYLFNTKYYHFCLNHIDIQTFTPTDTAKYRLC